MMLRSQKRIAAALLGCSKERVVFDAEKLKEIKEAITKADMRELIKQGIVRKKPIAGISKFRANLARAQRAKGRRKGWGTRKGKAATGRENKKNWQIRMRLQRGFISLLKDKKIVTPADYTNLYRKVKGGFFRSKRHIKLYLEESGITKKK